MVLPSTSSRRLPNRSRYIWLAKRSRWSASVYRNATGTVSVTRYMRASRSRSSFSIVSSCSISTVLVSSLRSFDIQGELQDHRRDGLGPAGPTRFARSERDLVRDHMAAFRIDGFGEGQ